MSWIRARDAHTIHLIMASASESLRNIHANGQIMLQILGDSFTYGIRGRARIVQESIEGAPVPASVVEMTVDYVKDDLTPGREFHAQIESWWPSPARQAVEDHGLTLLKSFGDALP